MARTKKTMFEQIVEFISTSNENQIKELVFQINVLARQKLGKPVRKRRKSTPETVKTVTGTSVQEKAS